MLEVWGRRNSFNVQKVLWLVGELGLPHRHIPAGGSHGGLDDPAFRRMNPHGRVPVIRDGDLVVWESHAILRYLAAQYGGAAFWPGDAASRSFADRWIDWSATELQPDFLNGVFWGYYRTPEAQRDLPAIERSLRRCARHFGQLDAALAGQPYLAGAHLSLADIPAGTALYRYFNLDIPRPKLPHVEAWYDRLQQRAAYQAGVMLPFDDLHGRLDY